MRRGNIVIVAATGHYCKPRPAVVVQTNAFPDTHGPVVICQMTSFLSDAPDFRVTVAPSAENGLRLQSQVMTDKPITVTRDGIGTSLGRLNADEVTRLNVALAFVLGLSD